jgi:hypothetical protein
MARIAADCTLHFHQREIVEAGPLELPRRREAANAAADDQYRDATCFRRWRKFAKVQTMADGAPYNLSRLSVSAVSSSSATETDAAALARPRRAHR